MKVRTYCDRCKQYYELEIDPSSFQNKSNQLTGTDIPVPQVSAGLQSFSLVHEDHTVVVQVDKNGAVRRQQILERIGIQNEKVIATIVSIILDKYIGASSPFGFYLVSTNPAVHSLIQELVSKLVINRKPGNTINVNISDESVHLQYGQFSSYLGPWKPELLTKLPKRYAVVVEVTPQNIKKMKDLLLKSSFPRLEKNKLAILFDAKELSSNPAFKEQLNLLFLSLQSPKLLDIGSKDKLTLTLQMLLDD